MRTAATWAFLGDSIVEGVGSRDRVSFVTGVVERLREVGDVRVENLASEATTARDDLRLLPRLREMRPDRVIIQRGALESIVRPACLASGDWPAWVPRSWRKPVAMDPRVYFSEAWWRRAKQRSIDALKQRARLGLLERGDGRPLETPEAIAAAVAATATAVRDGGAKVTLLTLLPVDERTFPGSMAQFSAVNARLGALAGEERLGFVDWAEVAGPPDFARDFLCDGFHPSPEGARRLGHALAERLLADPA